MTAEAINNNTNTLNRTMNIIDSNFEQLNDIQSQILLNKKVRPFKLSEDLYSAIQCIEELDKYSSYNSFFYDMFVYFGDDKYIYNNRGSYSLDFFLNNKYNFQSWDQDIFIEDISNTIRPWVRPSETVYLDNKSEIRLMTFMTPLTSMGGKPYATLLVLVNEDFIIDTIRNTSQYSRIQTFILDENDHIIFTYADNQEVISIESNSLLELISKGNNQVKKINGEEYFVSGIPSGANGWKYISLIPASDILSKANKVRTQILLYVLLTIIFASVVIYMSMRNNYFPIKDLEKYAKNILKEEDVRLDEIGIIHNAIKHLENTNTDLAHSTHNALKEHMIRNLLKGKYSAEEFQEVGYKFDVIFAQPNIVACSMQLHTGQVIDDLAESVRKIAQEHMSCWVIEDSLPNRLILIFNFDNNRQPFDMMIQKLHSQLTRTLDADIVIGVGEFYRDLGDIPYSYMESIYAIDYRFIKGNNSIIYAKEIAYRSTEMDNYPYHKLEQLKYLIWQNNIVEVENTLDALFSYTKEHNLPLSIAKRLCFDIIGIVHKAISELGSDLESSHYYMEMLIDFQTVDELDSATRQICDEICDVMQQEKLDKVMAYIQANYADINFSIQGMGDHFGLNTSYLSQYFRNKTGENIIDYVTDLRIEHAKVLLRQDEYSVKEIGEMVSYANPSSFIRRFKQRTGMTPGEYARKHI